MVSMVSIVLLSLTFISICFELHLHRRSLRLQTQRYSQQCCSFEYSKHVNCIRLSVGKGINEIREIEIERHNKISELFRLCFLIPAKKMYVADI
jgi:hypothetical protein